jgi:hypothetical protein
MCKFLEWSVDVQLDRIQSACCETQVVNLVLAAQDHVS